MAKCLQSYLNLWQIERGLIQQWTKADDKDSLNASNSSFLINIFLCLSDDRYASGLTDKKKASLLMDLGDSKSLNSLAIFKSEINPFFKPRLKREMSTGLIL